MAVTENMVELRDARQEGVVNLAAQQTERTKEDHCTPEWLLDVIRAFSPIGLDPCSNPWSKVAADKTYSRHNGEDGLALPWEGSGLVFVNPPYSVGKIMPWVLKADDSFREHEVETIMLLPATPDTRWFREAFYTSKALCFLSRRVAFDGACPTGKKQGAMQPSSLFYWGGDPQRFMHVFKPHGIVIARYGTPVVIG